MKKKTKQKNNRTDWGWSPAVCQDDDTMIEVLDAALPATQVEVLKMDPE